MIRTLSISLLIFFFTSSIVNAQEWRMGILALNDGQHIVGEINYDFDSNSIQIKYDDQTKTFSAYQFYTFRLIKNDLLPERNFYVLKYGDPEAYNQRQVPLVFESIINGEVSLLVRSYEGTSYTKSWYKENNFDWDIGTVGSLQPTYKSRNVKVQKAYYRQYLAWKDGRVLELKGGKKERMSLLGGYRAELIEYVKEHDLNLRRRYDMAKLVQYYNSLVQAKSAIDGA